VIGVGAQDSYDYALDFVAATGTTSFPMVWDESFESWRELGIAGQPQGRLLDQNGQMLGGWAGRIPEEDVLATIAEL
jgi:hypothetical protein